MNDMIVFALICYSLGLFTGVFLIITILIKAITGFKRTMRPPKFGN